MDRQFHRNESSWNVRSRGTKVPQERKFEGANVPRNESSTGAKVLSVDFSLPGTKVQRNEKARYRWWCVTACNMRQSLACQADF